MRRHDGYMHALAVSPWLLDDLIELKIELTRLFWHARP
jgi:hypothetical protein